MTVFYRDGSMAIGTPAEIVEFERARRGERRATSQETIANRANWNAQMQHGNPVTNAQLAAATANLQAQSILANAQGRSVG